MKASESLPNFPSKLREYTNFSVRGIKKVCKEIGPRPCASEAETKAHEYMAKELKTCSDTVTTEPYSVHPDAFMGWFKIDAVMILICVILLNLGLAAFAFIPIAFAVANLVLEFMFYKQFTDPLYPKKTSHNTIATRKASGETKRHIIIGGHVDSSYEWRPTYFGGKVLLFGIFILAAVSLVYVIAVTIATCALGSAVSFMKMEGTVQVLAYTSFAAVPGAVLLFFFLSSKLCVEGANDNLTGVFASIAILKYLQDNNIRFENTDVSCLVTGGEESGLRGAKAFAKAHAAELKNPDIETVFIGVDTLRDYETMSIYYKDMSGITQHDKRACAMLKKAGETAGIDLPYANLYCGASDAAAITQAGINAVAFAAMDPGPPRYYHTRLDTADNLDPKTIEKCQEILLETVFLFDEQGLKESY